ncbi:MAG: hypothetical protein K2F53_04530, partial [Rikenellaceae bacterium]|nr:hypothetical protein [Rikenellaceae bacterium]
MIYLVERGVAPKKSPPKEGLNSAFVSLFSRYTDPKPIGKVSLFYFLTTGQHKYRKQIEEIRQCESERKRRLLKSKLPAITPAGEFSRRCNTGLLRHSGFVCVDIDGKDNPDITDFETVKASLADFPGLAYAGLSVGGNGLYLLIRIATPESYAEHLNAIMSDLCRREIIADRSCKDIARLRGISFDPAPILNPSVSAYTRIETEAPEPITQLVPEASTDTARRVSALV